MNTDTASLLPTKCPKFGNFKCNSFYLDMQEDLMLYWWYEAKSEITNTAPWG